MFCYVFYPTVFENCHKVTGQSLIFIPNNKCLVNIRKRMVNLCILGYWLQQPCAGQVDYLATSFSIGEILPCEKEWINSSRLSELKKISFYHFPFSMGSQRVWHDLATEQQQQPTFPVPNFSSQELLCDSEIAFLASSVTCHRKFLLKDDIVH